MANAFLGFFAGAYTVRHSILFTVFQSAYVLVLQSHANASMAGTKIYATNMTKPMIEIVYYSGLGEGGYPQMPTGHEKALRTFIYVGSIIGMIGFGFLADIYGRRTLYGYELTFVVFATLGFSISSTGAGNSLGIIYLLCIFRFLIGVGVGGDYPVSAAITSEFAPTRHRDSMLATVFFAQPLGYLVAALVALAVVADKKEFLQVSINKCHEDADCLQMVDRSWRWVIGIGAILSCAAIWLRRTIPESPLYTAEVLRRPLKATYNIGTMRASADQTQAQHDQLQFEGGNLQALLDNPEEMQDLLQRREEAQKFGPRVRQYWADLKRLLRTKDGRGLWSPVFGTAMCWLLWDMAFYGLGASSHDVYTKIWDSSAETVYDALFQNAWHSLVTVSLGSVTGGSLMIWVSTRSTVSLRRIQLFSFLVLCVFFIATGVVLRFTAKEEDYRPLPVIILYFFCELLFELGPNFTTFMIPAQLFPTTHRALLHGLAAAMGKVGAVVAQSLYEYVTFPGPGSGFDDRLSQESEGASGRAWLGFLILCMIPFMLAGAVVTYYFVPELRDGQTHARRNLEELGQMTNHAPRDRQTGRRRVVARKMNSALRLTQLNVTNGTAGPEVA